MIHKQGWWQVLKKEVLEKAFEFIIAVGTPDSSDPDQ
jgi:hypothetical protein